MLYKYQPFLEKRHNYLKSVLGAAALFLKTPERIEALLFLYYLALMLYALIERDLQLEMKKNAIVSLPIYPEQRECRKPTAERIIETLLNLSRHDLYENKEYVETFFDSLNSLQIQIINLLKIDLKSYCQN